MFTYCFANGIRRVWPPCSTMIRSLLRGIHAHPPGTGVAAVSVESGTSRQLRWTPVRTSASVSRKPPGICVARPTVTESVQIATNGSPAPGIGASAPPPNGNRENRAAV